MPAPSSQRVDLRLPAGTHLPLRPLGEPTRGKTRAGRLRQVDVFCALYAGPLLARRHGHWRRAAFVDLGFGQTADTTLESARRFHRINPELRVLGVEIDPLRVASARRRAGDQPLVDFRLGGFNLPLASEPGEGQESARLVRAFNVLRQYEAAAVPPAWDAMARGLAPEGLIVEGSSSPSGALWVANVLRAPDPRGSQPSLEALVFGARLGHFVQPRDFQAVLPKQLIHGMLPGEPIHRFFADWAQAARMAAASRVWGPRRSFSATAGQLGALGWPIDLRRRWLSRGILIWRRPRL